jgi:hypothetical protein
VIPFWLAVVVCVVGGLGPYAGSAGFVIARRRGKTMAQVPPAGGRIA